MKKIINNIKKKTNDMIIQIRHICSNVRYKTRHTNLLKKYNELEKQYDNLKNEFDKDYLNLKWKDALAQAKKYKEQRDLARKEYASLRETIDKKNL